VVHRLEEEYEGTVEFRIVNVDTDPAAERLVAQYRVAGVPMFVFLNSDGSVSQQIIGKRSEDTLRSALDGLR